MPFRFVHQPFDDGFHLADFIEQVVDEPGLDVLQIVVAWAKRSGVEAIRSAIDRLHARGGTFRAIVGISQGGTSRQALESLIELADHLALLHHPGRTFHPKVYLATGESRALALVGSHNLTLGGVTRNYEAGVLAELNLAVEGDLAFLTGVRGFVERLFEDDDTCIPLNHDVLARIAANPRYPLTDEDQDDSGQEPVEGHEGTNSGVAEHGQDLDSAAVLFRASEHPMRFAAKLGRPSNAPSNGTTSTPSADEGHRPSIDETTDAVVKRWYKKLPRADAQQLVGSQPSNTMTLVQFGHPIDSASYFHDVFFADCAWRPAETRGGGQPREVATIECEIVVMGRSLGVHLLDVRHTPGYDSQQANRTSELAWRSFGEYLRSHDLTGSFASLEKTAAGRYRLILDDAPSGPFEF